MISSQQPSENRLLEAQYILCYHSFYPGHLEGKHQHLMNDQEREYFRWAKKFNSYDLYTRSTEPPHVKKLRPYYEVIAEFFPAELVW